MKKKKMGKKIIEQMEQGALPASVAHYFKMSEEDFFKLVENDPYLTKCYKEAWTGAKSFYEKLYYRMMLYGAGEKDLAKIFYSHYFEMYEKKALQLGTGADNVELFKTIAEKLPV